MNTNAATTIRRVSTAVLVASLVAAATVALFYAVRQAAAAPSEVPPEEVAAAHLRAVTGSNCQMTALFFQPEFADDRSALQAIDALNGREGWLSAGRLYAGSAADAATAFGGVAIAQGPAEQWVVKEENGRPTATRLSVMGESRSGEVWALSAITWAVPDEECAPPGN